jgi:hypothetical protein
MVALMGRACGLWSLIRDNPRFACYGRTDKRVHLSAGRARLETGHDTGGIPVGT